MVFSEYICITKLQQKCCHREFTNMDCSMLHVVVLLRENFWSSKGPAVVCLSGSWVQFLAKSINNVGKFYKRFVVLWSKYNNQ